MKEKQTKNIVISGTNYWNPGDDFVRDGVIRILKELFSDCRLNFLFYNFNQDFFPQSKFSGISNTVSKGDLDQYRDHIDAVVIAGLSAGTEIKDLYNWVIANGLQDRVYLIGAGYENSYVERYISEEPEATIFKNARVITGRTKKTPEFITELNLPYHHVNCPAILSVPAIKELPAGRKIERVGFSIQLPHEIGVSNHCCSKGMYDMAVAALLTLSEQHYEVEVVAHHKTEYFHFLELLKGRDIPVLFSSFYQDLFAVYPRFDLVVTTRLHSSLFANGHGIPGIIINDTDRHTHCLEGFPHSVWVDSIERFVSEFERILACDLASVAVEAERFKKELLAKYVDILKGFFLDGKTAPNGCKQHLLGTQPQANQIMGRSIDLCGDRSADGFKPQPMREGMTCGGNDAPLSTHFFTIVLNGEPFIRRHIDIFRGLPFRWHWHIIEGVADLKHDTAWSLQNGARITDGMHRFGRSNDGTSEYLDDLAREYPENVTVYRKPLGIFWDGKLEMVNAPLKNIGEECLLWQVDSDEIWTTEQLIKAHFLFGNDPSITAAYYTCRFFVGDGLVITTKNTYGNHPSYEWLRTWRYRPGDSWNAHEPPRLIRNISPEQRVDVATLNPVLHEVTEANGLIFDHFAYVLESQLRFKESYYGYADAVDSWKRLQNVTEFPVMLRDYFPWVKDEALVDRLSGREKKSPGAINRILWIRSDSIGDNVLASSMLPHVREHYRRAEIIVVCQEHIAELYEASPCVDRVITFNRGQALRDDSYLAYLSDILGETKADLALNSVYSRDILNDFLTVSSFAGERIGFLGNLDNITGEIRDNNNRGYTRLIRSPHDLIPELERHREFLAGIGVSAPHLAPTLWITGEDDRFAADLFKRYRLSPERTVALFPCAQWDVKLYERYGEALAEIFQQNGFAVIALGAEKERGIVQKQLDLLGVRAVNLAGTTTLRQTAAMLARCRLAVGADSAAAHMACAVDTPNVIIYGGGHFGRFFPYLPLTSVVCLPLACYGCNWKCGYERAHCIRDIAPELLAAAVRETLERGSEKPRVFTQGRGLWNASAGLPEWREVSEFIDKNSVDIRTIDAHPQPRGSDGRLVADAHPSFSVVTPSLNQGRYIVQTIESVIAQGYPHFEHIVVDGGSTDNTIDILKSYSHIRWISEKDRGQSDAINKGLRLAKGDIIAWINSDDWYEPGVFARIAEFFEKNPEKNVVMGECNLVDEKGVIFDRVINHERGFEEMKKHWISRSIPTQPAVFFRRRLLEEFGLLDESLHYAMDYDLWMRFARENRFYHLDLTVSNYRFHDGAKGGDQDWNKFLPDCRTVYDRYCSPRVSVVIPCYNYADYLGEAVESVIAQTFQDFEIIIVNDGSTDNTVETAGRLIAAHPNHRIRLISQENSGQPAASRNRGIAEARGEYILPLDADDMIDPSMLQKMVDILDKNAAVHIVYCDTARFGDVNDTCQTEAWSLERLAVVNVLNYCSLYRKRVWQEVGGYRLNCGYEDWDFWISAAEKGFQGQRIAEHLFFYRIKGSGRFAMDQKRDAEIRALIVRNHPGLYDEATREWAERLLAPRKGGVGAMRLLLVAHNFPPHWFAGVEIYTYQLAKALMNGGCEVTVLHPLMDKTVTTPVVRETAYGGLRVLNLLCAPQVDLASQISNRELEASFAALLSREGFDMIHFHHTINLSFSLIAVAKELGYPVCVTLHDFWFLCPNMHLVNYKSNGLCQGPDSVATCIDCLSYRTGAKEKELLTTWLKCRQDYARMALSCVDLVTAPSRYLAEKFRRYQFVDHDIEVLPLGIAPVAGRAKKAERNEVVFGFLGNIHEVKNVYFLANAFKDVKGSARLLFFGNGQPADIERLLAAIAGDPRMEYKGGYEPGQLPDILAKVDVTILPSRIENYPLVPRESLSAGVPVIASRVGGLPEIVRHLENGILFEPDNRSELTCWMQKIADDPGMIEVLASGISQPMTVERDAAAWVERYNSILKREKDAVEITAQKPDELRVALYSLEQPEFACAKIRMLAPFASLGERLELIRGVTLKEGKFLVDTAAVVKADIIILQRSFATPELKEIVEKLFASGKPVIYDLDDNLLALPDTNPHKAEADKCAPLIREILRRADAVTVSTTELKDQIAPYARDIHIIPNLLDERLWDFKTPAPKESPIVIALTGTPTHGPDIAIIEETMERIRERYRERVFFIFMGTVSERLTGLKGCRIIPFTADYASFARTLQGLSIDIALIPLADNPFNRCKSNIKWLEYSACGIVGIYSDLPPYRCVKSGETGLLVRNNTEDWYNALVSLIENPEERLRMAKNAQDEVIANYTLARRGSIYLDTYRGVLENRRRTVRNVRFSIIIMTWNRADMLDRCLSSLFASLSDPGCCEVIVGDNGSTDHTDEVVGRYRIDRYIRKEENIGLEFYRELFAMAEGEFIIELDDDVIDLPRQVDRVFAEYFENFPDYGFLGLDVVQNRFTNGAKLDSRNYSEETRNGRTVQEGEVIGCCACIRRETFQRIGGFTGVDLSMAMVEDGVITRRVRNNGLRTGIIKGVKCFHACGPFYSREYGYLDRDIEKYAMARLDRFASTYRGFKEDKSVDSPSTISVIIPLFNKIEFTRQCLDSLVRNTPGFLNYEVILVDNASSDGTAEFLRGLSGDVTIITNLRNLGFARACNQGARLATGDYLVFLNNDTIPRAGWLEALIDGIEQDGADICGSRLLYPDGRVQHAGVAFNEQGIGYHIFNGLDGNDPAVTGKRFMQCVTAACMIMQKELFLEMKGFDEGYINGFEDVDLCLRAGEAGRKILYVPDSNLIHFEETSEGRKAHDEQNALRFLERWGGKVRCDDNDFYQKEGYYKEVTADGRIRVFKAERVQTPPMGLAGEEVPPSPAERGAKLKEEQRYDEALEMFKISREMGDTSVLAPMGDCLANLGRTEEAEAAYREALENGAEDLPARIGLGVLKLLDREYAEAERHFGGALEREPDNAKALSGLGMVKTALGKEKEGFNCFTRALNKEPENLTALFEMVKCAYSLELFGEAERHLDNYLRYHPADLNMIFSHAGVLLKMDKRDEAREKLETILLFDPGFKGAQEMLRMIDGQLPIAV